MERIPSSEFGGSESRAEGADQVDTIRGLLDDYAVNPNTEIYQRLKDAVDNLEGPTTH